MVWSYDILIKFPTKDLRKMFVVEACPNCGVETIVWSHGVTECQFCKAPVAPCGVCMDEHGDCNYFKCPYGCNGTEDDLKKEITMPNIEFDSVESCELLYSIL